MRDDDEAGHMKSVPAPDDGRSERFTRLTTALKSLCQTRSEQELAVYILLSELVSGSLDREIPIPGPRDNVFGYLVPPGFRSSIRLTPERVVELHQMAQARDLA